MMTFRFISILVISLLVGKMATAQAVFSKEKSLEGMVLYPDFKKDKLFYYAPNDLQLGRETNGRPKFQLIQMGYTGRAATGDQGEKRFMNMVQLTVEMPPVNNNQLRKVRTALGGTGIQLRPLPIHYVEGYLITAFGQEYKRLGELGTFESGAASRGSYWTERTFTLRLNNADAQILWEQVDNGKLALSINYAFYANVISGEKVTYELEGDSLLVDQFDRELEDILEVDTLPYPQIVKANAFAVNIDVDLFPEVLKRIDANAHQTVAYPLLEVRCFDFTNNLRPDLGAKAIEIEAIGVGGQQIKMKKQRFFRSRTEQNALQIKFPYAVRMDQPLRYRISELSKEGEESTGDWITRNSWVGIIDITTLMEDNPVSQRLIDIETEVTQFSEVDIQSLEVAILYQYKEELRKETLSFLSNDRSAIKPIRLLQDKDTPILVTTSWKKVDGSKIKGMQKKVELDDYVFVAVPNSGN